MLKKISKPSGKAKKPPVVNPDPPIVDRAYFDDLAKPPVNDADREQLIHHYIELLGLFGATVVSIKYINGQYECSGMTGTTEYYGPSDSSLQRAVFFFIKHIMKAHHKLMYNIFQGFLNQSQV
ncbi:MAG: hypothetical protein IPJ80_12810 [Saprospiraceae bacterium]|nr:hypothetical protein [Saprospiraceae bacterium]MBK7914362.1 hypothetical protein [Saprospiraceae bacterium]